MTLYGNSRTALLRRGGKRVVFRAYGPIYTLRGRRAHGEVAVKSKGDLTLSATITVGLNVGSKQRYVMRDVARVVAAQQRAAGLSQGASYGSLLGIYQRGPGEPPIREKAVRVYLINRYDGLSKHKYLKFIKKLAKAIRRCLHQEAVLVVVTRKGRVVREWEEVRKSST